MTEEYHADRELLRAAQASLERLAQWHAQLVEPPTPGPDDGASNDDLEHGRAARLCRESAATLGRLDPNRSLGRLDDEALYAGRIGLALDAMRWRQMASEPCTPQARREFEAQAAEADRLAEGLHQLRDRLFHRDRADQGLAERRHDKRVGQLGHSSPSTPRPVVDNHPRPGRQL